VQGLENLREYGSPPFAVIVIHGGPGAAGSMAPVARELSRDHGILEPLQTALSIDGQVTELHEVLEAKAQLPVTLIGHSWGAWLSLIFAARHPSFVKKIILVGSGPVEEKYALVITGARLSRLSGDEIKEVRALTDALNDPAIADKNEIFSRYGKLMSKADAFNPVPGDDEEVAIRQDIYQSVWAEAEELRRPGELLKIIKRVECPVLAIHGDFDPHPAEGVEKPLRQAVKDFRPILLKYCGHEPWKERRAMDRFYQILEEELVKK